MARVWWPLPVTSQVHLQALDLHWNKIDAGDASAIFQGCPVGSGWERLGAVGSGWERLGAMGMIPVTA